MNAVSGTLRQGLVKANKGTCFATRAFTKRQIPQRCLHQQTSLVRPQFTSRQAGPFLASNPARRIQRRHESNQRPLLDPQHKTPEPNPAREDVPSYQMTFTCRKCAERSSHQISKQGYHHGTILITCPGCKNRHLISDHLKIFSDTSITLEDILKEKGQMMKKGHLGAEGDVEFWDDGTETKRGAK